MFFFSISASSSTLHTAAKPHLKTNWHQITTFSQECFTVSLPKELHSSSPDLTLILKPPGANKSKEARALSHQICRKWNFVHYPWQSSSVAQANICKWIIANKLKMQTCRREQERPNGAEESGWVWHSRSALSRLSDLGQLMDLLSTSVFQTELKITISISWNLLITT